MGTNYVYKTLAWTKAIEIITNVHSDKLAGVAILILSICIIVTNYNEHVTTPCVSLNNCSAIYRLIICVLKLIH